MEIESAKRYKHVMELGAGDSYSSLGLALYKQSDRVTLYEPNQLLFADLKRAIEGAPNVTIHPFAVHHTSGEALLYYFGYASFLEGNPSFMALAEPEGIDRTFWLPLARKVSTVTMDEVESEVGEIDCLILTVNGSELPILQNMKSRPEVLFSKHYVHNGLQGAETGRVCRLLTEYGYVARVIQSNDFQTFFYLEWRKRG